MANPRNAAGVFFSGLNGIRFFAAAGVILHHFEQIKWMFGVRTLDIFSAYSMQIDRLGPLCVSLFFVLSGFLITFLLLEETSRFGKIDVRKFYIRRILRIWPVYFLLTFVSFFLLPGIHLFDVPGYRETWSPGFWPSLGLFLVFCPQLVPLFYFPGVNYAQALWSVGVEEWFYAVWPWLIRFTRGQITLILLAIIIGLAAARFYASGWVLALLTALRFDCMAVGGLFAVLLFRGDQYRVLQSCRSFLFRVDVQIIVYFLFFASFMRLRPFILANETQPLIVSLFFGYAIVNIGANAKTIIRLENRLLHWLGDLSYGLYCYNWIAIVPTVVVVKYLSGGANGVGADVAIFAIGSFGTLALAVLSYEFVERPCLRLKQTMFTLVKTPGPSTLLPSPSGSEAALAA
jgi:peptidoglycan/LPS O-acetylase OafA/YrhL